MDWGAFTKGLAGGIQRGEDADRQRQLLKLKKRELDLDEEKQKYAIGELKRKITEADRNTAEESAFAQAGTQQQAFEDYQPDPEETSLLNPNRPPPVARGELVKRRLFRTNPVSLAEKPGTSPVDIAAQLKL